MSNASKYDFWDRNSFSTILTGLLWGSHTTQQRLAEAIGCSRQTVSLYANGNASPDAEKLKLIADFFHVSTDYLLGRTNAKTQNADLRAICDYTGLSEGSVNTLYSWQENKKRMGELIKEGSTHNGNIETNKLCITMLNCINEFICNESIQIASKVLYIKGLSQSLSVTIDECTKSLRTFEREFCNGKHSSIDLEHFLFDNHEIDKSRKKAEQDYKLAKYARYETLELFNKYIENVCCELATVEESWQRYAKAEAELHQLFYEGDSNGNDN